MAQRSHGSLHIRWFSPWVACVFFGLFFAYSLLIPLGTGVPEYGILTCFFFPLHFSIPAPGSRGCFSHVRVTLAPFASESDAILPLSLSSSYIMLFPSQGLLFALLFMNKWRCYQAPFLSFPGSKSILLVRFWEELSLLYVYKNASLRKSRENTRQKIKISTTFFYFMLLSIFLHFFFLYGRRNIWVWVL